MKKSWSVLIAILLCCVRASAYPTSERLTYGEDDGISSEHLTELLQDRYGFIWIATWNGLNRFDGREFVSFKTHPGDGSGMNSDRIRKIAINDQDPDILNCKTDNEWYHFSLKTGTFTKVSTKEAVQLEHHPGHGMGKALRQNGKLFFALHDKQGMRWMIDQEHLYLDRPVVKQVFRFHYPIPANIKCIFRDHSRRIWITSKEDKAVRIYSQGTSAPLFLTSSGTLSHTYSPFATSVYTVFQSSKGDILLGCKPGGLYRLKWNKCRYTVEYVKDTEDLYVYDIEEDRQGRLWLAPMGHGIVCLCRGHMRSFHVGMENKVRRIYLLPADLLMATSTEGLVTMSLHSPGKIHLNRREPDRAASLSASACMSMVKLDGHYFIATESGGIDEILSINLLSDHLSFRHYDTTNGLGSDVILSMATMGHQILAVSSSRLMLLAPKTEECRNFGAQFFNEKLRFSDATPVRQANGVWIFGLHEGAVSMSERALAPDHFIPNLVLTSITIGDKPVCYAVNNIHQLDFQKDERSLTLTFAALDYRGPKDIQYAYRMEGDSAWHYLGANNTVALPRLTPGKFVLQLRCTNAEGSWSPTLRTLEVNVIPTFTETVWFNLLLLMLFLALITSILWVRNYIRKVKKSQQETLTAYLALIEKVGQNNGVKKEKNGTQEKPAELQSPAPTLSSSDKAFMNRVMKYVEAHLSDSDADIADMARETAVSVSGLNRKMKLLVGLTPGEFLKEARIKHACTMLRDTAENISVISFACGFSDPKYFSRVFRQSTGMSPSQYRENVRNNTDHVG